MMQDHKLKGLRISGKWTKQDSFRALNHVAPVLVLFHFMPVNFTPKPF